MIQIAPYKAKNIFLYSKKKEILTNKHFSDLTLQSMRYDKIIVPLLSGIYTASYTPTTRILKAQALAEVLPQKIKNNCVVSGEAALWLHFFDYELGNIDIVMKRNTKISQNFQEIPIFIHEGKNIFFESERFQDIYVASPERSVVDMVKWSNIYDCKKMLQYIKHELDYAILSSYIESQILEKHGECVKEKVLAFLGIKNF